MFHLKMLDRVIETPLATVANKELKLKLITERKILHQIYTIFQ